MAPHPKPRPSFTDSARRLRAIGRRFDERNWVLGTSGNFSVVLSRRPFTLAITASAVHKGRLTPQRVLRVDKVGRVLGRSRSRPSAETRLHLEIARRCGAGAVLHTHSVWGTIVSDLHAHAGGLALEGYEMLKGLSGVASHDHREWLPIVENDQDMGRLAKVIAGVLTANADVHGFLLRRHGLYTWGDTLEEAERHAEILEFLLEATGRRSVPWP